MKRLAARAYMLTTKIRLGVVISALGLSAPAVARSDISVLDGFGTYSCGQFAEMYRQNPQITERIFFQWARGFMSGLNAYLLLSGSPMREDGTDLRKWSEEQQQQAIRAYCDAHPLKPYYEAVEQIYEDMRRDQSLLDWRPPQAIEQLLKRRQRP
jgi:hypothetical protein